MPQMVKRSSVPPSGSSAASPSGQPAPASLVVRDPDDLLTAGVLLLNAVRDVCRPFVRLCPLFSGGYDSLCACHVAAHAEGFDGKVYHIRTGIGAQANRDYVESVCKELGWKLVVLQSPATYERFVTSIGFPGPGSHQWVYNWIKDRCITSLAKGRSTKFMLVTGCRSQESARRMGHTAPVKYGELSKRTGRTTKLNRVWVAPCYDWSSVEQKGYRDAYGFPDNRIKESPIRMSGECFCGAFAMPGEIELIRQYAPDVAQEIDRLTVLAREAGTPSTWGTRPRDRKKGLVVAETGPMCSSCDRRAAAAGLVVIDTTCSNGDV